MKKSKSIFSLKKLTVAIIQRPSFIFGGDDGNNNLSTDDPLSNKRRGCASEVGGSD